MAINVNYSHYSVVFVFLLFNLTSCQLYEQNTESFPNAIGSALDEALKLVSAELLNDFRSAHGLNNDDDQDTISRSGRSADTSTSSQSPDHNFQRLVNITPRFRVCNNPLQITNVQFRGSYLSICISADQSRQVTIGEVSLSTNRSTSHVRITKLSSPVASAAFESSGKLHVLIADQSRSDGVTMNVFENDFLSKPRGDTAAVVPLSLHTPFPNLLKLWYGSDGSIRLAVSTLPDPVKRRSTYFSKTHFFKWDGFMFDRVGLVDSFQVSDICPFTYGGQDFIVILNSAATPSHPQVDSYVYRINFEKNDLTLVQSIRFHSAVDCETFDLPDGSNRVSKVAYLAVANNEPSPKNFGSVIYRFNGANFIASQSLPTIGATKIKSFQNPATGAFALLVADMNGVKSYQYNGWRFAPSPVQSNFGALAPGVVDMDVASVGPESLVFICNPRAPTAANAIALAFEKDEVLQGWRTRSLEWCQSAKSLDFDSKLDKLDQIMSKDVFYIDQKQPIEIHGDLHLHAPTVDVQGILSAPYVYNHEDIRPLSHKMTHDLHELEQHLIDLERRAERATHLLSKALRLDLPDQVVSGQYTFDHLDVTCGSAYPNGATGEPCNIGNIFTSKLNGEDVSDLSRQIIRVDRDQTITHPHITFNHIESVSDINLYGNGLINGINISNLVSKSGRHVINSAITFSGPLTVNSIHASGLVNGIKFTNETVLLKNGDQNISSSVEFTAPLTTRNLQVDYVNSQAIRSLLPNIVTVDGNHVIKGKKTFKQIHVTGNMNINSSISGIDLAKIHDNLLWTHGDQTVSSNVILDSLSVGGNLNVDQSINGISLPGPDIVLNRRREPVIITGHKTFASSIKIDHLHVKGTLNGLGLIASSSQGVPLATGWPEQLNIMLRTRQQSIPVEKTIAGSIHLAQHSTVQGTVNGVDLSELYKAVVKYDTNTLSGSWSLFGPVTFEKGLTVRGTVNGVNISHFYQGSLKLNHPRIPEFSQKFVFDHAVITGSLSCTSVNGKNLQRDFITKDTPQEITGTKTFKNGLHILNNFEITGTFNGLPLHFLNDSLLSSTSQVVRGPKVINGDLYVNDLFTRVLNDINLDSELIYLNSPAEQYISGRKNLKNIKVSHGLNVKQLNVAHTINGVAVHDLLNGTMLYSTPQRVTGMKTFKHITVPRDSRLTVTTLSGYPFSSLVADAVYVDTPANITGNITFKHPNMAFKSIQFFKSFDGITDRTFRNNWLLRDTDQEIDGDVILADKPSSDGKDIKRKPIEITGDLDMEGNLNGHQVRQLNSSIVKVNEPAIVRGPIIFTATVKANSHVNLSGKFQGVKLSHEAVRRSQPNARIFGVKTFKSHLSIGGNLTVRGYLDGILIDDLCSNAVRSSGRQNIRYPLTVIGNVSAESLSSGGRVAGVEFRRFLQLCVHKDDTALQRIRGKKHFKNLWIVAPVTTSDGRFGGVDVRDLNMNYMSLTEDQLIPSVVHFTNGVSFESPVYVDKNFISRDGLIHMNGHGYNFSNIRDSTLRLTGDQDITVPFVFKEQVNFSRDLIIDSPVINRIPLKWLAPRNARKRELTGSVEFDQVYTRQLIMSEGSKIQGVDLSRMARSVVDPSAGNNNIQGSKHFSSVTVDDLYVTGTLNGFKIDKDHILLASPTARQVINARAIFNHVRVNARLDSNSINGVNLTRWSENLVLSGSNENSTIIAPKTFSGPVRARDTWTMKLIDGLNVDDLNQAVFNKELAHEALQLERQLTFHQDKLTRISRFLDHQEQCVDHYSVTRNIQGRLIEIDSTVNSNHLIATRVDLPYSGCSHLRVHHVASKREQTYPDMLHPNLVAFITFNANGYNSFGNSSTIVSVSGSPVAQQTYTCLSSTAVSALGRYVAQITYSTGHKTYVTLHSEQAPRHLTIVRSSKRESCVLIASSPESDIICISEGKSIHQQTYPLPSRQFIAAYLTEWRYTCVASITMSHVRISKWNTNDRNIGDTIQEIKLMTPERETHSLIHFTGSYDDPQYLVIAEAKSGSIRNSRPLIRFFKRQAVSPTVAQPFIETQQTHEKYNVLSMSSLNLLHQNILFLLTSDQSVRVYRLQGASGWIEADTLSLESLAITSHVLNSGWSAEKGGHWLALSSHDNSSAIVETAIGFRPSH